MVHYPWRIVNHGGARGVFGFYFYFLLYFIFWPCHMACGILVPQPGTKTTPPAVEAWSVNHWTAGEDPCFLTKMYCEWNLGDRRCRWPH